MTVKNDPLISAINELREDINTAVYDLQVDLELAGIESRKMIKKAGDDLMARVYKILGPCLPTDHPNYTCPEIESGKDLISALPSIKKGSE